MIGSVWRYSHFLLAILSSLFLLVAAVTGAILAVEPVANTIQPYNVVPLDKVPLSQTVAALKENFTEVLDLEITSENFVKVSVFTNEGESQTIYVNPLTAERLGEAASQSAFFSFITNVHRSLFLKSIGRAFIGVASLLLCFIAVTGVFLLAQRQGGFKNWFVKVKESNFGQRYHIIFGRWFLLPLIIVGATGVFLSAEKFSLLPNTSVERKLASISSEILKEEQNGKDVLFQNITLDQVRKITFPFSEDPDDFYLLELRKNELIVHQYTGKVLSEVTYPFVQLASRWSTKWHTGQGNVLWSIILFLASLSLLFFIISGFNMSIKKRKKASQFVQKWTKDEAEYIVLVGSETGSTLIFANAFAAALSQRDLSVFVCNINEYSTFRKAIHLIVFTATYGDGDAPTNARKFETLIHAIKPNQNLKFSVVGFGSLLYPNYCHFAVKVDAMLHTHECFFPLLPLVKINNQSEVAFQDWVKKWNEITGLGLKVTLPFKEKKHAEEFNFEVIERTFLNIDNTFLLQLKPEKALEFQSGDLLAIVPPNSDTARHYSIAEIKGELLLSIRAHEKGLCSEYLATLKTGDTILASIEKNESFHLPEITYSVFCIANGTGIAPFLGMFSKNQQQSFHLLWGGRGKDSFNLYKKSLGRNVLLINEMAKSDSALKTYQLAFSQNRKKTYVQDILLKEQVEVAKKFKDGCVFMICGSMAMQQSVLDTLETITITQLQQPLSDFESNGQLLMDCY
ncbi:PepSY domain-containing protein [Patiriisocius marinus]|uniref:PepSY domain-containing protein n=1 Tax=Patiriisocius marinus TaxID=1397112 RepID=UPI00232C5D54|nr:PepSY domain-containing protein [Patiriisocius marinus]